jgi:hypothetical protein
MKLAGLFYLVFFIKKTIDKLVCMQYATYKSNFQNIIASVEFYDIESMRIWRWFKCYREYL